MQWQKYTLLGDIDVTVPRSICHGVHCAQVSADIDTISFAYNSPMSLPDKS